MEIAFFLRNMFLHLILSTQFIKFGIDLHIFQGIVRSNKFIHQHECLIHTPHTAKYLHLYLSDGIEVEARLLYFNRGTINFSKGLTIISSRLVNQSLCPGQFIL